MAIVFDIETVPVEEESLSREELEYIFKYAQTEEEEERERERMSLWAFTAHLVSLALYKLEDGKAVVLYAGEEDGEENIEEMGVEVFMRSYSIREGIEEAERRILQQFWKKASDKKDHRFVSFNGRRFDSVFLMLRSFVLGVKVKSNLLGSRFDYGNHFDILDALTFHGQGRKYTLDFVCRRLGLPSPKEEMEGKDVKEFFRSGRYREIALYNLRDTILTGEIYKRLRETLGEVFEL